MIGAKPKPATLADAIAAVDFGPGNAELERLRAEAASVAARDHETREEISRLANAVRDYQGPKPDAVAAAILAGKSLTEATQGTASREQLEAQRDALAAALEPLRKRADALRAEIAELENEERNRAFEALAPYVAELAMRQKRAAEEIVETYAALAAIGDATGRSYIAQMRASEAAVKGVLGGDNLLGWVRELPVPEDVKAALAALASKSAAVRQAPETIPTRFL